MSQQVSTIYDIMRSTGKYGGDRLRGEVGVEIETETEKAYDYPKMKFWNTTKDNSLRDFGVEYILKQPMDIPDFEKALSEFDLAEKKYKFRKGSISTSVHVHLNFLNDTYLTMANFVTAYALVENLLIRYSGPDRLSNLFCLPMCDAEGVKDHIVTLLSYVNRNMFAKVSVPAEKCKYGGLNPSPLSTLGTLEVRTFRGETDTKIILRWIEILMKLKTFARRTNLTPVDIMHMWKDHRAGILDLIFHEYAAELRWKDPKTKKDVTDDLIRQNLKFAADFACVSKDWTKFGLLKIKPVYKEKCKEALDEIAQRKFKGPFDSLQYQERVAVMESYHNLYPNQKIVDADGDI